jgi:hypothetical protein
MSGGLVHFLSGRDDFERAIRQGALNLQRLVRWRHHPLLDLGTPCQDDRHCFGMDRADVGVGVGGEKAEKLVFALNRVRLGAALAVPCRPDTGEHRKRPSSSANQVGVFRGLVSAYSQNDVKGTTQRFSGLSQGRQCGLFTFRMLVIGAPPNAGGPGMPQRANANSRTPSGALRAIGAG